MNIRKTKSSVKKYWSEYINDILGRNSKESNDKKIVRQMKSDGQTVANKFVDFLGTDLISVQLQSIFLPDITDSEVRKIIMKIKKESPGLDNIKLMDHK